MGCSSKPVRDGAFSISGISRGEQCALRKILYAGRPPEAIGETTNDPLNTALRVDGTDNAREMRAPCVPIHPEGLSIAVVKQNDHLLGAETIPFRDPIRGFLSNAHSALHSGNNITRDGYYSPAAALRTIISNRHSASLNTTRTFGAVDSCVVPAVSSVDTCSGTDRVVDGDGAYDA